MQPNKNLRAGFTLIELMAVIVIIGILMAFLVPRLGGLGEGARIKLTRADLESIGVAIAEYEHEAGDYPSSRWEEEWGSAPNRTNLGAEALCVHLWSGEFGETGISEDKLMNSDEDRAAKNLTSFGARDLFELKDAWDNPIAYFHRRDYDRGDLYLTFDGDTGEVIEAEVKALISPKTKSPYRSRTFQLISAGPNGLFGDDDDITNFDRE